MEESASKSSLDNLLQNYSKIVHSFPEGFLAFHLDKMNAILESLDPTQFPKDMPVAILGVMGPKGSGKSLLTNFIIHCLQKGDGGWMTDVNKKSKNGDPMMERGYSWNSVSNPVFFEPPESLAALLSGLYIWPEPVRVVKDGGKNDIAVWIVHTDVKEKVKGDEHVKALEKYLAVVCSRIMEILWKDSDVRKQANKNRFIDCSTLTNFP